MKKVKFSGSIRWFWCGLVISVLAMVIFVAQFGSFRRRAAQYDTSFEEFIESIGNLRLLNNVNLILYGDFYNVLNHSHLSYEDIYYPLNETGKKLEEYYINDPVRSQEMSENYDDMSPEENSNLYYEYNRFEENSRSSMHIYLEDCERLFEQLSAVYDYLIYDEETGIQLTNAGQNAFWAEDDYHFLIEFCFDADGRMTVGDRIRGDDAGQIRRTASDLVRYAPYPRLQTESQENRELFEKYTDSRYISNCTILYGLKESVWKKLISREVLVNVDGYFSFGRSAFSRYRSAGVGDYYLCALLALFVLAFFLPFVGKGSPYSAVRILKMPLEGLVCLGFLLAGLGEYVIIGTADYLDSNTIWYSDFHSAKSLFLLCLFLTVLFFAAWYMGICFRLVREAGPAGYIRERSLIYRIFPYLSAKAREFYRSIEQFDLTKNARKKILQIVIVNAIILFVICSLWVGGFLVTVIYSVLLYFILRKYVSNIQKRYGVLLRATNEIAKGNLNVVITEDLGVFEPFRPQIYRIQQGFKMAVEEEVKSQRMKTELITNVSHDLKTPLTAIITYVDLLKEEGITGEQRREYLDTLERKALRLKVLIEDLFEVSKATSGTVRLNIMDVDILNLIRQVELEMSDKLAAAGLEVRLHLPDEKVVLPLDSQKTYRVYENLFGNIAKYSLPGTRVYINASVTEEEVSVTLKNISAEELHIDPAELTERFVRGDSSRNTEGSGLGLAIAKSFMELQGGQLLIAMEDDLFKVTTVWNRPQKS